MANILRNLRIDEVSSVDKGAGEGVKILLMKRQQDNADIIDTAVGQLAEYFGEILNDRQVNKNERVAKLFEDFGDYLKRNVVTPENVTPQTLSSKLREMVAASGVPLEHLIHSPRGARLAERLNNLMKKEEPMPHVDIYKLHSEQSVIALAKSVTAGECPGVDFSRVLMGHAELTKGDKESVHQRFAKLYEGNVEFRKADAAAKEANWVAAAKVNRMSVTPVSVEVGNTLEPDDAMKAYRQLVALSEKQHKTFEQVMLDNPELTARTYTSAHRPNVSSTSGSKELQHPRGI